MNILYATSEAVPFAKTGGLADVSNSLPKTLSRLGNTVRVVLPAYRQIFQSGQEITDLKTEITIPVGDRIVKGNLLESRIPNSDVQVILIQHNHYFDRPELYTENGWDYSDNCERFVFFSRAVLELIDIMQWKTDVLHTNDWQTGLVPAYLEIFYRNNPLYSKIATLHTIHNLAYQGVFWHYDMPLTGIGWKHFTFDKMEFHGKLNFLKTGLAFAMGISTVSPRYAQEIQTPYYGCSLESVLQFRKNSLRGILNGICTEAWNPATDPYIVAPFTTKDVFEKKPICKAALQQELGLDQNPQTPLLGIVGRLAEQKGIDLILDTASNWIRNHNVQYCFLGTGDSNIEYQLTRLQAAFPKNVAVRLTFSNELAHKIEAGSDMFLMPSRYEPCGLNQMYSQLYGTVPIVHETGGLADTIVDATEATIADGTASGFSFIWGNTHELNLALWRAVQCYYDRKDVWQQIMLTCMNQDWSWTRSAREYLKFYEELSASLSDDEPADVLRT